MPTVTFYGDTQKTNSTHIPSTTVISGDCVFKHPTDLYNPTIVFNGDCHLATSFKVLNKYYWVTKMVSVRDGVWEVTGRENVLATHKSYIGLSRGFVQYADTANNYAVPDTRLAVEAGSNILGTSETLLNFIYNANAMVSVGITCIDHNEVNLMSTTELRSLLSAYSGKTPTQIQKALGAGEVTCLNSITGAFWLPLNYSALNAIDTPGGNIWFGTDIDSGITRRRVSAIVVRSSEITIPVPVSLVDWRAINSTLELIMPLYGNITIPGTSLLNNDGSDNVALVMNIYARYYFNLYSGDYTIELYRKVDGGKKLPLSIVSGNASVPIPVGANIDNSASRMIGAMAGIVTGAFSGQWGNALGNTAEAYGILTHTLNTSTPVTISTGGGGSPYVYDATIKATLYFNPLSVPNPNSDDIKKTIGVPVMRSEVISTIVAGGTGSGYVQGKDLALTGIMTDNERQEIESLFNQGFFYET